MSAASAVDAQAAELGERLQAATMAADAPRGTQADAPSMTLRHGRTGLTHEMAPDLGTIALVQQAIRGLLPRVHENSGVGQALLAGLAAARAPLRFTPQETQQEKEETQKRKSAADVVAEGVDAATEAAGVQEDTRTERVHAGLLLFHDDLEYLFTAGTTGTAGLRGSFEHAVSQGMVRADLQNPAHVQLWARELLLRRARSTLTSRAEGYLAVARRIAMAAEQRKRAGIETLLAELPPVPTEEETKEGADDPQVLMNRLRQAMQAQLEASPPKYNDAARRSMEMIREHTGTAWREISAWLLREPVFVHACYLEYCGMDTPPRDERELQQRARIVPEPEFEHSHREDVTAPRSAHLAVLLYLTVVRTETLRRTFMRAVYADKLPRLLEECPEGPHSGAAVLRQVRWLLEGLAAADRAELCQMVSMETPFPQAKLDAE